MVCCSRSAISFSCRMVSLPGQRRSVGVAAVVAGRCDPQGRVHPPDRPPAVGSVEVVVAGPVTGYPPGRRDSSRASLAWSACVPG